MMKYIHFRTLILMFFTLTGIQLSAQTAEDTTIVLDPAMFIPADTGYYLAGVDKDLVGNDGITEHYDGCYDAYGDADHREGGMQNGWEYGSVIIFRGCDIDPLVQDDAVKGETPAENWPSVGNMIQLSKHKNALSDSATYGYVSSPAFTNIESLTVKVSTDLSISSSGRQIFMMIEASLDDGETWEYVNNPDGTAFIYQQLADQGGDIHTYTAGSNDGFDEIITASQAGPVKLRVLPMPPPFTDTDLTNGERLKIWEVTIEAQTVVNSSNVLVADQKLDNKFFTIDNGDFISLKNEELRVYNLSGVLIGAGSRVPVCRNGLFIVKNSSGNSSKIYLK